MKAKSNIGVYQCRKYQSKFSTTQSTYRHEKQCLHDQNHVCLYCGKYTTRKDNHKRHIQNCVGNQKKLAKEFECKTCNIVFSRRGNLEKHATTHQKPLLSCQMCGKQYSREDNLKRNQILRNGKINQSKSNDVVNSELNIQ